MTDKAIEAAIIAYYKDVPCYADTRTRLRAAIAAYEQAMWRPIEEAPRDGRFLLLENGKMLLADSVTAFGTYIWRRVGGTSANFTVDNPTHYRPLPPPPGKEIIDETI